MRSALIWTTILMFAAGVWCAYVPSRAAFITPALSNSESMPASWDWLRRSGEGSTLALRHGLTSASAGERLRCAQLLAVRGDYSGERCLLEELKRNDSASPVAEAFLSELWSCRDGPDNLTREKLMRTLNDDSLADAEKIKALNAALGKAPAWAGGYVRRAQVHLQAGEAAEARRDALIALMIDPDYFGAMLVLARVHMALNAPSQAQICLEQAVRVDPRLKEECRKDFVEINKALEAEKRRRRNERRRASPLI